MAKSQKKYSIYLREVKGKRRVGAAQKQETTIALYKPHDSAGKWNWATAGRMESQEQSLNVSLKCQSWGSPNITAQHDCSPQDNQRPFTWTTQKPKNIQKNKLAMFLYFQSGLVPHLFPWSCLHLLLATLHLILDRSRLLFFLSNISFVSPWVFSHSNQFFPVSIWVWSPSKHF